MPLIVFEGVDGCGKSTQARLLAARLRAAGAETIELREPGGTALGEELRRILLDPATTAAPAAELFCYLAARAQLCHAVLGPLLARGGWAVLDRFWYSTIAYQCHGLGVDEPQVRAALGLAVGPVRASAAFWLDLPVAEGARRRAVARGQADRIEQRGLAYLGKVHDGYAAMAAAGELVRLDAGRPPERIAADILAHLGGILPPTSP
jgi:dTMP kinase